MARRPSPESSDLERQVASILRRRFPHYTERSQLRNGADRFSAEFHGDFLGQPGKWLVECKSSTDLLRPKTVESLGIVARFYEPDDFDGLLLVTSDPIVYKDTLMEMLRVEIPDKVTEVRSLSELEPLIAFSGDTEPYPGRIVTIGHNSDQYADVIEATNAVIQGLQTSNSHGLIADLRDRLLVEVKAGRTLLKATTVRVSALGQTIIPALQFIAENCAKVIVGELAKNALKLLAKLMLG